MPRLAGKSDQVLLQTVPSRVVEISQNSNSDNTCKMIPTRVISPLFRRFRTAPPIQIIRYHRSTLPHIRYFTSTNGLRKNIVIHSVGEGEKLKAKTEDEEEHRMINNNNPNPAISLPGGVSWPFSGNSSLDAALTTIIGLGLGDDNSLRSRGTAN
jgi:hypothetical protein